MKKSLSKKTILKEAGALLIAAILVLTAIFVFTPMTRVVKADPTVILSEGFEGSFPPAGWTTTHPDNWQCWYSNYAGGTSPELAFVWYPSSTDTFRFISPPMDTTGMSTVQINFNYYINHYGGPYTVKVETSTDKISWTTVWEIVDPTSSGGGPVSVMTGANVGSDTFYVSWTFEGNSYNINYWYIDNAKTTSGNPGNDYEMTSINSPVTGPASGAIIPEVTVTNYGPNSEAIIPVTMTIEKLSGETVLEYTQTVYADFDPYQVKDISFPAWTPAEWGLVENADIEYTVCACVESLTDPNPTNDCKCESFTLHYSYLHDVGVMSIDSPIGTVSSYTQPVIVTIKNYGQNPESDVPVEVEIGDGTLTIYDAFVAVTSIQPGETKTLYFPDITFSGGVYYVTACTQLVGDVNPGNDCLTVTVNTPPIADAGPDQTLEQTSYVGAEVTLDGSGSYDPNPLTYEWTWDGGSAMGVKPTVTFQLGTTTVTLTVSNGKLTASDTVDITIVDTTPPVITGHVTVEQESCEGTVVPLTATATDICDPAPVITSNALPIYPLGTTIVTFTATDVSGNKASYSIAVTVVDTTPPGITLKGNQIVLWPPDHKYQTIKISDFIKSVTDICGAVGINDVKITSVSSDEPENAPGDGDGNTWNDIVILDAQTVKLRAEREGTGNGRVYTINFEVTDLSGNTATGCCKIWVPHDQGAHSTAIDDGASAGYTVYYYP
jgi:hypothetical protein